MISGHSAAMTRTVSSLVAAEDLGWVQGERRDLIVVVDASGSVAELDLNMEDVKHVEDVEEAPAPTVASLISELGDESSSSSSDEDDSSSGDDD